jgi:DNA replication and repair protein RecF
LRQDALAAFPLPANEARPRIAAIAVTRLMLTDFRGYARARLALEAGPVVLYGANGAGKTNLLEALSFLAPGRGMRRAKLSEIDRRGGVDRPWALAASVTTPDDSIEIGTGRDDSSESGERRHLRIDGVPAKSQQSLSERLSLAWLTPQMDRIFLEGASARRRFLDRLVCGFDPVHWSRLSAYEKALRHRARLLRDSGSAADAAWLAVLEDSMAQNGVALAAARIETVAWLDAACRESSGVFPRAGLRLTGVVEEALGSMPALACEDWFRRLLAGARGLDAESGVTQHGPHRADLAVTHLDTGGEAGSCSTGEQKALLIAILLAHARLVAGLRGAVPLLLLDEVTAHLDAERRSGLFAAILDLGAQAWLAGTDAALFQELRGSAQFFSVAAASITPG